MMPINRLIDFLNTIFPISLSLEADIRRRVVTERFKRGHTLSSPSMRKHAIWYIATGLAKEYYYHPSGKMVITAFWNENELMVDTDAFFGKKHSEKYIELIDDCTLLTLNNREAHELLKLHPESQALGFSILAAAKRKDSERSQFIGLNAKESNIQFCKMFPAERISVSDAASYLGLIRTTLSTIRSQAAKSKFSSRK